MVFCMAKSLILGADIVLYPPLRFLILKTLYCPLICLNIALSSDLSIASRFVHQLIASSSKGSGDEKNSEKDERKDFFSSLPNRDIGFFLYLGSFTLSVPLL